MTQEALKLALEALEDALNKPMWDRPKMTKAITAIEEALREHAMREVQRLGQEIEQECWCTTCRPITMADMRFVVCPDCGNKRCPKANDHRNACTNSNEVGQEGSSWEHVKPLAQHDSVQAKPEPELCKYGQEPKSCTSSPMDCQCAIDAALAQPEHKCNSHPKAPHGFNRNASHANDRYTCECESWDAYEAGYQAGVTAGIEMSTETEQKPVAWLGFNERGECREVFTPKMKETFPNYPTADMIPVYTTPPQEQQSCDKRTWVGLTDEEYKELHLQIGPVYYYQEYGQAIEAKLKEKNT